MGEVAPFAPERLPLRGMSGDLALICVDEPNDLWAIVRVETTDGDGRVLVVTGGAQSMPLSEATRCDRRYRVDRDKVGLRAFVALRGRVFRGLEAARQAVDGFALEPRP